jgi:protein involved in polysaccharide export with SLBB domain
MRRRKAGVLGTVVLGVCMAGAGCNNKLWDPSQVGRFRPTPAVNVILDSLGVADEAPVAWETAEEPRPIDIVAEQGDYVLCVGDILRVSIFELYAEGQMVTNEYIINETGRISIPDIGVIQVVGMTETQLEEHIRKILSPNILKNPSVSVTMLNSQQRTFSVIGDGVDAPGRHVIPRYDFRLTDALATVRGPRQFNVSHIYVSRSVRNQTSAKNSSAQARSGGPIQDRIPAGREDRPQPGPTVASAKNPSLPSWANPSIASERALVGMVPSNPSPSWGQVSNQVISSVDFSKAYGLKDQSEVITPTSFEKLGVTQQRSSQIQDRSSPLNQAPYRLQAGQGNASNLQQDMGIEWVFQDGRWIPVPTTGPSYERRQPDIQTTTPSRTTQRLEVTGPVETYPRSSPYDLPRMPAAVGNSYSATDGTAGGGVEWVFQDGRWVPVQRGGAETGHQLPTHFGGSERVIPLDQADQKAAEILTWEEAIRSRLIRIPTDKLLAGDPRYNIVIQPGDTIHVPVDIVGECCIMGNVNRAGYINLTGRPMTLKMAIAAAGGLGPLAYPKNCEVVRRIGDKREEIVLVDLDRIASGEQPDFFIKPNDLINVGTHYTARWRAILRNAFRATYGVGFVYDRNFADADYGSGWPHWF